MEGAEGFKEYLGEYFTGHSDSPTTIDQIVAEGDKRARQDLDKNSFESA
jgi:hypothetical protein